MSRFRNIFPDGKPLIAMAHVPALPGTPLYDANAGLPGAVAAVHRDVEVLLGAGFDAVLFCNENDRPYQLQAGVESAAALARIVTECKPDGVPFGVDFLWDARCALAVAADFDRTGDGGHAVLRLPQLMRTLVAVHAARMRVTRVRQ